MDVNDMRLTAAQAAGMLGVSSITLYKLVKNGTLPAERSGRLYQFRRADVEAVRKARRVKVKGKVQK